MKRRKALKLYGFNNLTKTLSFNIYDICYTRDSEERNAYIEYIDEQYNSKRLTNILLEVANIIDAKVLNIASQDYDPQGASVTILIAEEEIKKDSLVAHLDKSHLTVHTYPESHPENNISTFRVDIEVSTCGEISPLKALNYLINSFDSDIIIMDYRVRGFTRDLNGEKHYLDHDINSIQDFIDKSILANYTTIDLNLHYANIFHTKMLINKLVLDNYLFNINSDELTSVEVGEIKELINKEMVEIFYGTNIPKLK